MTNLETQTLSRRQPKNTNYLSPTGFEFALTRIPHVTFFCNQVQLPTVTLGEAEELNPNVRDPYPGDRLRFDALSMRFKVDEDMKNYLEIFDWMKGLGWPEKSEQYANIIGGAYNTVSNAFSDGRLLIQTSQHRPNMEVIFKRLFPVSLSPLIFDTQGDIITYLECDVSFQYYLFDVKAIVR